MVNEGVVGVLPEYWLVLVVGVMVVIAPNEFLVHCTEVIAKFEVTVQTRVIVFPSTTLYADCCI